MAPRTDFPPVRACIFDMDGLLIDSEDHYTNVTNAILREHGKPDLPWEVKAKLQGRPGPAAGKLFREWAQLPLSEEEFMKRQRVLQVEHFQYCKPLPGVEVLLQRLSRARVMQDPADRARSPGSGASKKLHLALATSSHAKNYELKVANMEPMMAVFPPSHKILGDDFRILKGRGKPLPDIYLLALQAINETIAYENSGEPPIEPEECLVFEDSVPGIEAGRRAGMRCVWVPHPGLLGVYHDRVAQVLAAQTGEHDEKELLESEEQPLPGSPGTVGEIDDGWAEVLSTLEDFDYERYGIDVSDRRLRSDNGQPSTPGTTDKELEAMTARADGKISADTPMSGALKAKA